MKRSLLLMIAILTISIAGISQQSNPMSSAHIVGLDGKAELTFDETITENFTIDIIDLTGTIMATVKINAEKDPCDSVQLPIENLRKGIYMVQVVSASGKTKTLKLQRN
jgi:methionine-rich copper-binding protein CopC